MKKLLAMSVLTALLTTACTTQTAHIGGKVTDNIKPTKSVTQSFFI
ncbi:TPA: lipoprotein bor, partial [Mannheimia haemolytica]|nr:lipoprotein bor [Mannheimia haemolytica]